MAAECTCLSILIVRNTGVCSTVIEITLRLQSALELVDIRLLDHLVVVAEGIMSLAARWLGLITLAVVKLTFLLESAA
ncbi:hypothetical protein N9G79_001359 [Escherichia coli]|nr:hypothetical protein [Escherichia coli]EJW6130749.1 hypothetical protein [Escherichia coli]